MRARSGLRACRDGLPPRNRRARAQRAHSRGLARPPPSGRTLRAREFRLADCARPNRPPSPNRPGARNAARRLADVGALAPGWAAQGRDRGRLGFRLSLRRSLCHARSACETCHLGARSADETCRLDARSADETRRLDAHSADEACRLRTGSADETRRLDARSADETHGLRAHSADETCHLRAREHSAVPAGTAPPAEARQPAPARTGPPTHHQRRPASRGPSAHARQYKLARTRRPAHARQHKLVSARPSAHVRPNRPAATIPLTRQARPDPPIRPAPATPDRSAHHARKPQENTTPPDHLTEGGQ